MPVESDAEATREERLRVRDRAVPISYQGVTKERIRMVLSKLDRETDDMVDAVFALLDDESPSWFSNPPYGSKFCDGATTAHIGAHVGILQRGGTLKLDREGRDYWIKPLRELGAIEPIYLDPKTRTFIPGHPKPKSPNSAYKLAEEFIEILQSPEGDWQSLLSDWSTADSIRERARLQAQAQELSSQQVETSHKNLIKICEEIYVPNFLPMYQVLFVDYEDGERVTPDEMGALSEAGISINLSDAMPDLLLWNPEEDVLWVIEAVISDGEVDDHKVNQILKLVRRSNKPGVVFTTAYSAWRDAARRQSAHKNIAPSTYIWISDDPAKHYLVSEISDELVLRGLRD